MDTHTYRAGDLPLGAYLPHDDTLYVIVVDSHTEGVELLDESGDIHTFNPDVEVEWNELQTACVTCRTSDPVNEDGQCSECAAEYRAWKNQGAI